MSKKALLGTFLDAEGTGYELLTSWEYLSIDASGLACGIAPLI